MMREGVVAALIACGRDVVDLGVVSTPVIQHAIRRLDAAGGVSIGASHNAAEWNALKFFGARGTYLSTAEAGELLDIYHLKKFDFVEWRPDRQAALEAGAIDSYLDDLGGGVRLRRRSGASGAGGLLQRDVGADPAPHERALRLRLHPHQRADRRRLVRARALDHQAHGGAATGAADAAPSAPTPVSCSTSIPTAWRSPPTRARRSARRWCCRCWPTTCCRAGRASWSSPTCRRPRCSKKSRRGTAAGSCACRWAGRPPSTRWPATAPSRSRSAGEGTGAVMMPRFRFVYDGIASMLAILSMMRERGAKLSEIVDGYPRVLDPEGRGPAGHAAGPGAADGACRSATPTAAPPSPTACASTGRTAGSTCASARPSRWCASSASSAASRPRRCSTR